MDPVGDALAADPAVKPKRLNHGPLMLEGMVPTGGYPGGPGRPLWCSILHPCRFNLIAETRDDRSQFRPSMFGRPDDACSSRSENPFVRTRDKEITSHLGDVFIFDAKPMYPIYNQQNSV